MFKTAIITVYLVALAAYPAIAQVKKSDRERANLIGPVKSVTSTFTDFTGENIEGTGYSVKPPKTVFYDVAGNEIEDQMVSDFGEQMGKTLKKFDSNRRLLESAWVDPNGKIMRKDVFAYVDDRLSEGKTFDGKGVPREKTAYVYDAKGRVLEEIYYDAVKPAAKTVYKYDSGELQWAEIAFFLIDGRKAIAPVGPCLGGHRVKSTYDDRGRTLTQDVFDETGDLKRGYRWTYDNKSNVATYISKSRGSTVTFVYNYEYDTRGNWVKQIAKGTSKEDGLNVFGKPATPYLRTTITTRKITYFQ